MYIASSHMDIPTEASHSINMTAVSVLLHLSGIIHGNEVGSLPTLIQLIEDLETGATYHGGKINVTLGNPEASKLNRRFVDADLNRLFLDNQPLEHQDT